MNNRMVWIDLETTGLDPIVDEILEFGMIITDYDLEVITSTNWIFNPWGNNFKENFNKLDDIVKNMHFSNGLYDEIIEGVSLKPIGINSTFINTISGILQEFSSVGLPMCGSTISFDRSFLKVHCPVVHDVFHYRNLDVSSFKLAYNIELERDLMNDPHLSEADFPKWRGSDPKSHRAIPDCLESIEEFSFYRKHLFK